MMKVQIEFNEMRSVCMKNYNGQCEFHRRDIHRCEVALCPVIEKENEIINDYKIYIPYIPTKI
jgi:hypothetical protein